MARTKASVKSAVAESTDFDFAQTPDQKIEEKMWSVNQNDIVEVLKNQHFWEYLFETEKDTDLFDDLMEKLQIKSFTGIYLEEKFSKELLDEKERLNYEFFYRYGDFIPVVDWGKTVSSDREIKKLFTDNLIQHLRKEEKKKNEKVEISHFNKSFFLKEMEKRREIGYTPVTIDFDAPETPEEKMTEIMYNVPKEDIIKTLKSEHFWECLFEFEKDTDLFEMLLHNLYLEASIGGYLEDKFVKELLDETEVQNYTWNGYLGRFIRYVEYSKLVSTDSEIKNLFTKHLTNHLLNN